MRSIVTQRPAVRGAQERPRRARFHRRAARGGEAPREARGILSEPISARVPLPSSAHRRVPGHERVSVAAHPGSGRLLGRGIGPGPGGHPGRAIAGFRHGPHPRAEPLSRRGSETVDLRMARRSGRGDGESVPPPAAHPERRRAEAHAAAQLPRLGGAPLVPQRPLFRRPPGTGGIWNGPSSTGRAITSRPRRRW